MATNEKLQASTDVETYPLTLTDWLDSNDTLSSASVSAVTPITNPPLSVTVHDYTNYTLASANPPIVRATGGVSGNRYTVSVTLITAGSRQKTEKVFWTIKD